MAYIPAKTFIGTLSVNVDNDGLSDAAFRDIVRNTLPVVEGSCICKERKPNPRCMIHRSVN